MADNSQTKPPVPPEAPKVKSGKSSKPIRVDLVNPTPGRRVIDNGIEGTAVRMITIESGETKRNVEIAEWVAKELRSRTKGRGKERADLVVYEAGRAPDPSAPADDADEDEDDAE